jgi:hypothetical protein
MEKKTSEKRRARKKAKLRGGAAKVTASTSPQKSQPLPKPGKRVSIGDALRQRGLDEHKFAERFDAVGNNLAKEKGELPGVKKAAFDYLKEWSRYLEPPRAVDREVNDRPVPFILVHHVERPVRGPAAEYGNVKIENGDSTSSDQELRNCSAGFQTGRC